MSKFKKGDIVKLKGDSLRSPKKTVRCYAEENKEVKEFIRLLERDSVLPKIVVCDWTTTGGGGHRQYYYEEELELCTTDNKNKG